MKQKAYSRGERKEMILNVLYSLAGDGKDPFMTAYAMAKVLGLNSAQHVRNIMNEMAAEGSLTFVEKNHRPSVDKRVYCPMPLIPMEYEKIVHEPKFRFMGKERK